MATKASSQDIKDYYANLLIIQYRNLPNARGTIESLVGESYADGISLDVLNAFDLETAVGQQLDILGKYIGLSRQVKIFLPNQTTRLNDDDYRTLLKLKLITNNGRASTGEIKKSLYELFPDTIRVYDNRDMSYTYFVSDTLQDLMTVIVSERLLPLPMSVEYRLIFVSKDVTKFFGFSNYTGINNNPNGFTRYSQGFRNYFLRYKDRFTVTL